MMNWTKKLMAGRYGTDQLSMALLYLSIIIYVFSLIFSNIPLKIIAIIPIIICYLRVFSKQIYKRQQENFKFIRLYTPILKRCKTRIRQVKEIKTHKYFKCPNCKQLLRVPRKKGNISITCPKCKHTFHQHS